MTLLFPTIGASIAVAGGDKLAGNRAYAGMFRQLGWSRRDMQIAAATEMAGGLLMVPRATRRVGGALVAAVSATVLLSELQRGDAKLAGPRGLVLLAALAAVVAPGRR